MTPSPEEGAARAVAVLDALAAEYPNAKCALDFTTPLELLIATILAAQARDSHINTVTAKLFPKYRTAKAWADAKEETLLEELKSTGFFRQKTRAVQATCRGLVERHGGNVPDDLEALVSLDGVGRKTANVVLGCAFGHPDRVAVDTHVKRLAGRLGFTKSEDPEAIEQDLIRLWPADRRTKSCHLLQFHGRRICDSQRPKCDACVVAKLCPSAHTFEKVTSDAVRPGKPNASRPTRAPRAAGPARAAAAKAPPTRTATRAKRSTVAGPSDSLPSGAERPARRRRGAGPSG